MSNVYFITHPQVNISATIPVTEWSLSDTGHKRMHAALKQPWMKSIGSIYASTEKKAVDGAQILSEHLRIPFTQVAELGENDRSATEFLPPSEFEKVADQFFANPYESIRGWETAADAQSRIVTAVQSIMANHIKNSGSVAIVAHGAVGALLLCHINGWPISRVHDQPGSGGGNYFVFNYANWEVIQGWQPIDQISV